MAPALSSAHLSGSDTEALGGVLAYDFGMLEPLEHVPLPTAQDTLSDSRFGSQPQPLAVSTPIAALQPVNAAASARTFAQPDAADGVQTSSAMAPLEDSATAPSANSWEEAIARWLDQADHSILGSGQTAGSVARSATEEGFKVLSA